MNSKLQRFLIFFIIMLPLTWEEVKKYWYLVALWFIFLIILNLFLGKLLISHFMMLGALTLIK